MQRRAYRGLIAMLSFVLACWTLLITACKAGHPNSQQQPQAALVTACRTAGESTQRLKGGTCAFPVKRGLIVSVIIFHM
jgi:hypothetical protein